MLCSELKVPAYAQVIARKLATVHHLQVPINKEPTWLLNYFNKWIKQVRSYERPADAPPIKPLEQELLSINFEEEVKVLFKILDTCPSPVVFSHNDLQEGNILLPSDANLTLSSNGQVSKNMIKEFANHIVFIDFEFCSYNYRGFDLGNHFCERMFDYTNPEWPHYHAYMDEFPQEDAMRLFIREYLKQHKQIAFDPELDTEDHIVAEAEIYALAPHLLWTLWGINNSRSSTISFGYMVICACIHFKTFLYLSPITGIRIDTIPSILEAQGACVAQVQHSSVSNVLTNFGTIWTRSLPFSWLLVIHTHTLDDDDIQN